MGSNDHHPTGSATLTPWKRREPKAVLHWSDVAPDLILSLVVRASKIGAYVGFGCTTDSTALLLYIKNGRLNERVALEGMQETKAAIEWICQEWLTTPL